MISQIKKILGLEKLQPDIQLFLDHANLSIARPGSFIVMLVEIFAFINSFFYTIKDGQDSSKWLLYHRTLYIFLFLAAAQLFFYSIYHNRNKVKFSRFTLNISLSVFFMALIVFALCISINDYIKHEQILVFITVELFVACLFMIKPYLAILLIIVPFAVFYYMMKTTAGISSATKINYPIVMIFFILVNIVRYQQYLKIATSNFENQSLAEQLRKASLYDFLTRLKNRNALNMDFEDSDSNLNLNYIVMLTDIDNFKSFNDTYGHIFGDELLKKFATILQTNFGEDYCYRYGGDEYLIVFPEIKKEDFLARVKDCEKNIKSEFKFSAGYSQGFISSARDLHSLINKADNFLYEAKNAGKNKVLGSFK